MIILKEDKIDSEFIDYIFDSSHPKYILDKNDTISYLNKVLYRVVYKGGTKGGYIDSEKSLSQYGKCRISENSIVYNSIIEEDAIVLGESYICDNSHLSGKSLVNNSKVYSSTILDNSKIINNSEVREDSEVSGDSILNNSNAIDQVFIINSNINNSGIVHTSIVKNSSINDSSISSSIIYDCTIDNSYIYYYDLGEETIKNFNSTSGYGRRHKAPNIDQYLRDRVYFPHRHK